MKAHRPRPRGSRPRLAALCALLSAVLALAAVAPSAEAQSAWNRRVEAVSVVPNEATPTLSDVHVVFGIHGDGTETAAFDASTEVELWINRTLVASQTVPVGGDPGTGGCVDGSSCGGSCGSGSVDGMSAALICRPVGACAPICDCQCGFPSITSSFPGQTTTTGDEIMVLLRPAPGAVPDDVPSDDELAITYGSTIFWDRQIESLTLVESTANPGTWDVTAEGTIFHDGLLAFVGTGGSANLGMEIELRVNGVLVATHPIDFQPFPLAPSCVCSNACATWDGQTHSCTPYIGSECHCGWPWLDVFPGVPVVPTDEIMVLLRPAPGALPELPGFEDDDERRATCCPGATDAPSVSEIDGPGLEQNRPNPFRDGTTIAFRTRSAAPVTLEVFDVRGRRLATLLDERVFDVTGRHTATWNGRTASGDRAPNGIYFYRLTADGKALTRKMVRTR
jgi:hypothetical protein